jgi:hypothetical protein
MVERITGIAYNQHGKDIRGNHKVDEAIRSEVSQSKTETGLFFKQDCLPIKLNLGDTSITTKKSVNILGLTFNSKLQWSNHVATVTLKANCSIYVVKNICKHLKISELNKLITRNHFVIII